MTEPDLGSESGSGALVGEAIGECREAARIDQRLAISIDSFLRRHVPGEQVVQAALLRPLPTPTVGPLRPREARS
jgi:hypothetical protein